MNLDEFGRKFDHKLVNEISKKIDKTDLKKNNTYLNKKVNKKNDYRQIIQRIRLARHLQIP